MRSHSRRDPTVGFGVGVNASVSLSVDISLEAAGEPVLSRQEIFPGGARGFQVHGRTGIMMRAVM